LREPLASGGNFLTKLYKHALCLHPYFRDSHAGSLGLAVFPPTGLEYVAAALQPQVERITFVDLRLPGPMRKVKALERFITEEIDLLCISINWEYQFEEVCKLVKDLPWAVTTVVGGKQATDCLEEVIEKCPNVDIVVRGEGEEAIAEIANGLELKDIAGISYRSNGQVIHNAHRELGDVNSFAFPDRSLRKQIYSFNVGGVALRGEEFDIILTARGCPYNCKFCTFTLNPWGQKRAYSARSIDSVIEEIRQISAGIILIADENFFVNPKRAKQICDRIVQEGIQKRFLVQSRIEVFEHPDVLEAAAKAGIKLLLLGIESPHDRILEQLNKGFDSAAVRRAFETFRQYPFYYHGYFIYGNVTETEDEMMQIPVFAQELGLDSITYQKLRVEKYSPLKELVEATPGYYVGDDQIVYSEQLGRPGLKRISRQITRQFYTPARLVRLVGKLFRIHVLRFSSVVLLALGVPAMLGHAVARKVNKKMRRSRLWRRFFDMQP